MNEAYRIGFHFMREKIDNGTVSTSYIASKDQLEYVLTKALSRSQHEHLLRLYGINNVFREDEQDDRRRGM